jgi:hypothetical protein
VGEADGTGVGEADGTGVGEADGDAAPPHAASAADARRRDTSRMGARLFMA